MKVWLNGKEWVVTFRYRDEKNTYCIIRELGSKRVEAVGHSRLRKGDTWNKLLAQKFSLQSALESVDREDRLPFWQVFFNRRKAAQL